MMPTRTTRWLGVVLIAGLIAGTGCSSRGPAPQPPQSPDEEVLAGQLRLVAFDSCQEAERSLRAAARRHVTAWGLGGDVVVTDGAEMAIEDAQAGGEPPPAPATADRRAAATEADHSGTNVHETGVDEPDLVKTDGRRIVTVQHGRLRVYDAQLRQQTGALDLVPGHVAWTPADLLLHGDHALVLTRVAPLTGIYDRIDAWPAPRHTQSRLFHVDLAGTPTLRGEYTIDGTLVDARSTGPVARVVVRSSPQLEFPVLPTEATTDERLAANQEVIDRADLSAWLPRYRVTGDDGISEGQVGCDAVHRPPRYTGTSMVTVLTFDLSAPVLGSGDPVSVVADGDTVYATGSSLYVASDRRWWAEPLGEIGGRGRSDQQTEIYKFDLSQPGPPRYVASGAVEGWLLNQYALSEWDGHLRVATTLETFGEAPVSESAVTVLEQRGERLVPVGSVTGLGEGELIYSVRFVGPTGYVVTFRQVDPLYTLDLSDPAAPARLGELKITGYSAYLHPIDAGRLIGVGQEADTSGRTLGTQVSLFDVSDLRDPIRLAQHHVSGGRSEAEFDPHAFLWWPAERLLVLPLVTYRVGEPAAAAGALVLRVEDDAVAEVATIAHPVSDEWGASPPILRSLVVADALWTVSELGLAAHALPTLERVAWLPFD